MIIRTFVNVFYLPKLINYYVYIYIYLLCCPTVFYVAEVAPLYYKCAKMAAFTPLRVIFWDPKIKKKTVRERFCFFRNAHHLPCGGRGGCTRMVLFSGSKKTVLSLLEGDPTLLSPV